MLELPLQENKFAAWLFNKYPFILKRTFLIVNCNYVFIYPHKKKNRL